MLCRTVRYFESLLSHTHRYPGGQVFKGEFGDTFVALKENYGVIMDGSVSNS